MSNPSEPNETTVPPSFPQDLPPRSQQNRANLRTCYSLHFLKSYNAVDAPDSHARSRRVIMNFNLVFCLLMGLVGNIFLGIFFSAAAGIVVGIFDLLVTWFVAWAFAIIGDAEGTRKVCGVGVGRRFNDAVIYASFALYISFIIVCSLLLIVYWVVWPFEIAWHCIAAGIGVVAWVASSPEDSSEE